VDQGPQIARLLRAAGTSAPQVIMDTLESVDVEARLRDGGLTDSDLAALRRRMLTPSVESA